MSLFGNKGLRDRLGQKLLSSGNNQMCVKYKKVLNRSSKYIIREHVNIQEKSHECKLLDKMIHESSQCSFYNTSDAAGNCNQYRFGNHSDVFNEYQTQTSINAGTLEELFKFNDCVKCLNLCSSLCICCLIYPKDKVFIHSLHL